MSLAIEVREVPIRLSVPIRKCDGCGGINETAIAVLRRATDGTYTADPELPKGWNSLRVGAHSLDLCDRCTAAAVLERRQAAGKPVEPPPPAPTIRDAVLGPEAAPADAPNGGDRKSKHKSAATPKEV